MKINRITIVVFHMLLFLIIGCVPGTKYRSMQDSAKMYMNERDELKKENIMLEMDRKELEARVQKLENETKGMVEELQTVINERDRLKGDYNILLAKVNDLEKAR